MMESLNLVKLTREFYKQTVLLSTTDGGKEPTKVPVLNL